MYALKHMNDDDFKSIGVPIVTSLRNLGMLSQLYITKRYKVPTHVQTHIFFLFTLSLFSFFQGPRKKILNALARLFKAK